MAITTLDGLIAGFQPPQMFHKSLSGTLVAGRPFTPFYTSGIPGAAVAPTPGLAGAALTSYPGQLPFSNPGAGNSYLARLVGMASQAGVLLLVDRLWHNSGLVVTTTTAQTVNSAAWPARDANGSTNGAGVIIGLEVSGATGAGAATPTISYTDQDGNAGATGSMAVAYASSAIGAFYPFTLAAGDTGVRSIQSCTLGVSMTSGTIHLVAYRVLAAIPIANSGAGIDPMSGGLPRMFDNTVPQLIFIPNTTTSSVISGQMVVAQG